MHFGFSPYVPAEASARPPRYEPRTTGDEAAQQAHRWELVLRLRELFLRQPDVGVRLLDEAVQRRGPELETVLRAAHEAVASRPRAELLRALADALVRLDRTREAYALSQRLLRCHDHERGDLIRIARLAMHLGMRDQARTYLIRAGVRGLGGAAAEASAPTETNGEERSDELGP